MVEDMDRVVVSHQLARKQDFYLIGRHSAVQLRPPAGLERSASIVNYARTLSSFKQLTLMLDIEVLFNPKVKIENL